MLFVFTLDGKVVRQEPTRRVTRGTQTREVRCKESLKYYVVPITPRLYTVVQGVPRNTMAELGIYRSLEDWHTSFFYINSVGVNYWITLARFVNKLSKWQIGRRRSEISQKNLSFLVLWNRDKKTGKQENRKVMLEFQILDLKQPFG